MPHINDVSHHVGSGAATTQASDHDQYVKLDEVTLPDGTKMKFFARKENAPTLGEVMEEVYDLASEALIRKLSK